MAASEPAQFGASRSRPALNLRILLVTAITGLVILGVFGATVPQVIAFRKHAAQSAIAAVEAAAQAKRAEAEALFRPGADILAHVHRLPLRELAGGALEERSAQYERFVRGIEGKATEGAAVATAFIAQTDRSMVTLLRNSAEFRAYGALPDSTAASPWLRTEGFVDQGAARWGWLTDNGWQFVDRKLSDYDPTKRPWWRMVENEEDSVLSGVYRSNVDDSIRMTLASPMRDADGKLLAVAGVDMHVSDLARAVRDIEISENGFAFIARRDGSVIAHPDLDLPTRLSKHTANAPNLLEIASEDRRDLILFDTFANRVDAGVQRFEAGDETWFGTRMPLRDLPGIDADLYAGAPLKDFTAAAEQALRSGLIISSAIAVVVIFIGAFIARAIARPVQRATDTMRSIASLDPIETVLPEHSSLAEIDALNQSVEVLRAAIRSFSRFAPTELVRDLVQMRQPLELGGTRREITVLFVDIEGFTSFTETEQHERVVQGLADYFEIICDTVNLHNGTLDKFIGDGAMAFWGAPHDDGDHTQNACNAVIDVAARIDVLNDQRDARGEPRLNARFGLHRGYAFVGNVGARDRFNYTALGDVVNTAARLESAARNVGAAALVTKAVALNAPTSAFSSRGEISLRGKAKSLEVFELILDQTRSDIDDPPLQIISDQ